MSNLTATAEQECDLDERPGQIEKLIRPRARDIGGLVVRRLLPTIGAKKVGPWVFLDRMGPASFEPGPGLNVRPHPHINLATVTYLFEGEVMHRDSLGNHQPIRPGALNLMVAGRGIVHSERERPEQMGQARRLDGLQLWLALPEEFEEIEPAFYHYPASALPAEKIGGISVTVLMGEAFGMHSPVKVFDDTLYARIWLPPDTSITVPDVPERAVYVAGGELELDGTRLAENTMAILRAGEHSELRATEEAHVVVLGGAPIGKRYIEWNFVSSRRERIDQAKRDWRTGRFPKVPGDEDEYIPLPG